MAGHAYLPDLAPPSSLSGRSRSSQPKRGDAVAGRYELSREIARGAMATVFEARHAALSRMVALKFVQRDCPQPAIAESRLRRATAALGFLRHPGIVEAFDAGDSAELGPFLALEMLDGRTLEGILAARRRLSIEDSLFVIRSAGEALAYIHKRGFVHRDIRPANIFLTRSPHVPEGIKLIDFGLAVPIGDDPSPNEPMRGFDPLGALEYVPSEQLSRPTKKDPRSDQYALAAVLLECLAGNVPAIPDNDDLSGGLGALRELVPELPQSTSEAIARAMAPSPGDRFPSVEAFLDACGAASARPTAILSPARGRAESRPTIPVVAPAAAQPSAETRRRFARAPYITPCRVVRPDGATIDGRSEDVSEGGLLIVLSQREESRAGQDKDKSGNEKVRVRFALPTSGLVATVMATVRWVRDNRGRCALGVEFDDLPDEARKSISTYVTLVGPAPSG
jgi:serine/threonine-protein kinase